MTTIPLTREAVQAGHFPLLHCAQCDWAWKYHQEDAPITHMLLHTFIIPGDIPSEKDLTCIGSGEPTRNWCLACTNDNPDECVLYQVEF